MALKAAKKQLRSVMLKRLASIPSVAIEAQSTHIFQTITNHSSYKKAKRIGVYLSMPAGEVKTDAIVRDALRLGKQVFVPYIERYPKSNLNTPTSIMEMVNLLSLQDYESLEPDRWGIPSISSDTFDRREHVLQDTTKKDGGLDLIFVPGVAFEIDSATGYVKRLGHGKGFYDLFLHKYRHKFTPHLTDPAAHLGTDTLLFGLALEEQYLRAEEEVSVPVGDKDYLLHGLIIGDGKLLECPAVRK